MPISWTTLADLSALSARNGATSQEEESHVLLRVRVGESADEQTVEVVQSFAGGPLGIGYVAQLCGNGECHSEFTEEKIFLQKGEPLSDYFHHLEISRVTGQYTASQRVGYDLLVEERGTCTVVTNPNF